MATTTYKLVHVLKEKQQSIELLRRIQYIHKFTFVAWWTFRYHTDILTKIKVIEETFIEERPVNYVAH